MSGAVETQLVCDSCNQEMSHKNIGDIHEIFHDQTGANPPELCGHVVEVGEKGERRKEKGEE